MRVHLLLGAAVCLLAADAQAQQPNNMTFFVSSTGLGKGADLGGLEGADKHCQNLAQAARRREDLASLSVDTGRRRGRRRECP